MAADPVVARKAHRTLEPLHAIIYFAPEAGAAYAALGSQDHLTGYFASRAAALGPVPAEVVIATFFNFNPDLVRRAIPAAWSVAAPAQWSQARLRAADEALRRLLPDAVGSAEVEEAAMLAREATTACEPAGRPLFAAHASLPWPEQPHLVLWHALTLLREHRGDGHVACLVREGIRPCEALVLHEASGTVPAGFLQPTRAWDDEAWISAADSLQARGWVDETGAITDAGTRAREGIEAATDRSALAPWVQLGDVRTERLRDRVRPLSKAIVASGAFT
jgi:hypothetical protein